MNKPAQFSRPILSDTPTEEQQKVILDLFLKGQSIRGMSGNLDWDVSPEGVETAIRAALSDLRDMVVALSDKLGELAQGGAEDV